MLEQQRWADGVDLKLPRELFGLQSTQVFLRAVAVDGQGAGRVNDELKRRVFDALCRGLQAGLVFQKQPGAARQADHRPTPGLSLEGRHKSGAQGTRAANDQGTKTLVQTLHGLGFFVVRAVPRSGPLMCAQVRRATQYVAPCGP